MSFSETRARVQGFTGASTPEYQLRYMAQETLDTLESMRHRFVEHLTRDLVPLDREPDLRPWLGSKYYEPANDNARECLETSLTVRHLYGRKISAWTYSALKCYDVFLLKHIQDDRKERIVSLTGKIKERDVYEHLIAKGGTLAEIGQAFTYIYQERSGFQHVQYIDDASGQRMTRRPSQRAYNVKRDLIVGWFRDALDKLLRELGGKVYGEPDTDS